MAELTKQDIGWLFEATLLNFEGASLTSLMSEIKPKHILLGKKVLDLIKEEWEKQ